MIKMKALRSFSNNNPGEGKVRRSSEFSAHSEARARELEAHGLAYRIEMRKEKPVVTAGPLPEVENKAADTGPLALAGGKTGAAEPALSSPPARAPRQRKLKSSAEDLLS